MRLIDSDKLHYSEFKCANGKTVRAINERDIQGARAVVEHGRWIRHKGRNEQCSVCKRYFPLWMLESKFDIKFCPLCGSYLDRQQKGGNMGEFPTQKQEEYAKQIAEKLGIELPSERTKVQYGYFISRHVNSYKREMQKYGEVQV